MPDHSVMSARRSQAARAGSATRGPLPADDDTDIGLRPVAGGVPGGGLLRTRDAGRAPDGDGVPDVFRRSAEVADPLGGTEAAPEIADALRRRRGSGRPLTADDADRFGGQFGTDLSGVRVHTDPEADAISRSVQATAFTHGSDIYFTQGSYSPGTSTGDHLLAHELAHVAQGSSGASGGSSGGAGGAAAPTIGKADDPAEAAADKVADSVTDGLRRKTFDGPSGGGGAAPAVSTVPAGVRRQRDPNTIHRVFGKAKNLVKTFFGKAKPVDDTQTGNDYIDTKTHEEKQEHNRRFRGSGPGENPDYSDPALFGQDPDEWKVTLAVAQEDTAWMRNVKDLKKTALKELVLSPRELLGDMGAAEQTLAQKTLMSRGDLDGKTEAEIQQLVEKFAGGIHDVGHTWVRLSTYVGGRLKELYTYGMWPQKLYSPGEYAQQHGGYAGPISVGPGEVRHPDVAHEDDATKAYKHYPVKKSAFDKALNTAVERYNSPPPYVLTGYNCTAFAREIVQAAGKSYPGKGLLPGMAYTPGNLYWAIMKEWVKGHKNIATQDTEEEGKAMGKLKARAEAFSKAGEENVEGEYKTTTFQLPPPGQQRVKVTLHDGATINYGMYPDSLDQQMTLDEDTEYTMIDDPKFTAEHDAVPLELGAQIVFVELDDFRRASAPPKKLSAREAFLAQGLQYWGTFRPPKDTDKPMGAWTEEEVAKKTLIDIKDPNATGDWIAVGDRGEIYWVQKTHLSVFKDPDSVQFDDEQDDTGGSGGGSGGAQGGSKEAKQRAAVVSLLTEFAGLGSMQVANMLAASKLNRDGVVITRDLIAQMIKDDPAFADEIATLLKCPVDDVKIDFG
jgi:hypothetical protein